MESTSESFLSFQKDTGRYSRWPASWGSLLLVRIHPRYSATSFFHLQLPAIDFPPAQPEVHGPEIPGVFPIPELKFNSIASENAEESLLNTFPKALCRIRWGYNTNIRPNLAPSPAHTRFPYAKILNTSWRCLRNSKKWADHTGLCISSKCPETMANGHILCLFLPFFFGFKISYVQYAKEFIHSF